MRHSKSWGYKWTQQHKFKNNISAPVKKVGGTDLKEVSSLHPHTKQQRTPHTATAKYDYQYSFMNKTTQVHSDCVFYTMTKKPTLLVLQVSLPQTYHSTKVSFGLHQGPLKGTLTSLSTTGSRAPSIQYPSPPPEVLAPAMTRLFHRHWDVASHSVPLISAEEGHLMRGTLSFG